VAINAAASSWAAIITFLSKGAEVTLLVAYALATVLCVVRSKAEAKGDQAAQSNTGTINRRYEKAMGLDN
jgi:heme/copper-type cytochrome/quinol oxidase subunit 2